MAKLELPSGSSESTIASANQEASSVLPGRHPATTSQPAALRSPGGEISPTRNNAAVSTSSTILQADQSFKGGGSSLVYRLLNKNGAKISRLGYLPDRHTISAAGSSSQQSTGIFSLKGSRLKRSWKRAKGGNSNEGSVNVNTHTSGEGEKDSAVATVTDLNVVLEPKEKDRAASSTPVPPTIRDNSTAKSSATPMPDCKHEIKPTIPVSTPSISITSVVRSALNSNTISPAPNSESRVKRPLQTATPPPSLEAVEKCYILVIGPGHGDNWGAGDGSNWASLFSHSSFGHIHTSHAAPDPSRASSRWDYVRRYDDVVSRIGTVDQKDVLVTVGHHCSSVRESFSAASGVWRETLFELADVVVFIYNIHIRRTLELLEPFVADMKVLSQSRKLAGRLVGCNRGDTLAPRSIARAEGEIMAEKLGIKFMEMTPGGPTVGNLVPLLVEGWREKVAERESNLAKLVPPRGMPIAEQVVEQRRLLNEGNATQNGTREERKLVLG